MSCVVIVVAAACLVGLVYFYLPFFLGQDLERREDWGCVRLGHASGWQLVKEPFNVLQLRAKHLCEPNLLLAFIRSPLHVGGFLGI